MLRVTIEILPDVGERRTLATIDISNVSELAAVSDYYVEATVDDKRTTATVKGHHRYHGAIVLVESALRALIHADARHQWWDR